MDPLSILCKLCGHSFKYHQQATFGVWYCDFEDACSCDTFWPVEPEENNDKISIPIPVDGDESYKYN